jgi:DNA replication ATP-dependent helicase Dna2
MKVITDKEKSSTHARIEPYSDACTSHESLIELQKNIQNTDLVVTSCHNVFNYYLSCFEFDFCLVNEASLIVEPIALGTIFYAKRFIMFGDYYQLNPAVKSSDAEKRGLSISLFRRLCERHPYKVVILRKQYRMNDQIASLSNTIAYKGLIRFAS